MFLLGRGSHLAQDLVGQSFGHLVNVALGTTGFDALFDGFRHGGNVAVQGVVNDGNLGHGAIMTMGCC